MSSPSVPLPRQRHVLKHTMLPKELYERAVVSVFTADCIEVWQIDQVPKPLITRKDVYCLCLYLWNSSLMDTRPFVSRFILILTGRFQRRRVVSPIPDTLSSSSVLDVSSLTDDKDQKPSEIMKRSEVGSRRWIISINVTNRIARVARSPLITIWPILKSIHNCRQKVNSSVFNRSEVELMVNHVVQIYVFALCMVNSLIFYQWQWLMLMMRRGAI